MYKRKERRPLDQEEQHMQHGAKLPAAQAGELLRTNSQTRYQPVSTSHIVKQPGWPTKSHGKAPGLTL